MSLMNTESAPDASTFQRTVTSYTFVPRAGAQLCGEHLLACMRSWVHLQHHTTIVFSLRYLWGRCPDPTHVRLLRVPARFVTLPSGDP
jgi:hypothetical protein